MARRGKKGVKSEVQWGIRKEEWKEVREKKNEAVGAEVFVKTVYVGMYC